MNNDQLPKSHNDLIASLKKDLTPVKPVCRSTSYMTWLLPSLLIVILVTVSLGLRPSLLNDIQSFPFLITSLLLIIGASLSAWVAIKLSIPGEPIPKWQQICLLSVPILLIAIVSGEWFLNHQTYNYWEGLAGGKNCLSATLILSLFPIGILSWITSKMAPLHPFHTAIFIALASLCLSGLGIQWHCAATNACHLAVWHYTPIFLASILIAYPLQVFLGKWRQG